MYCCVDNNRNKQVGVHLTWHMANVFILEENED